MNLNDLLPELAVFAATVLVTFFVVKIFNLVVRGMFRNWVPAVRSHIQKLVSITIWAIGLIFAFQRLGLQLNFLLLILGLIGLGVLIALKDTLENIGAKYFSDVYVPFKVGDIIKVAGSTGKVIEINPITTVLLTKNEEVVSIPNSLFLREKMKNITPHVWREILVPITIDSKIDLPEFESKVMAACNKIKKYLDERFPPVLTVKGRNRRSVNLVLTLMVKDPDKKSEIIDEVNRKISEIEHKMIRRTRQE
ncbi:MAG: mechanosensitive ion channel domain-containing protein [Candidatus Hadarchaeum sp.]|uniref:mechanosensitive ion channel domain-containing protein n=1 Tax=Candidatus Hadarchaeum sp. TaxID=2883567 RepID=UPI003D10888F